MDRIRQIEIDPTGRFKYVLIKVTNKNNNQSILCVRGTSTANYHADLVDEFEAKLRRLGHSNLTCRCVGGGRIYVSPEEKTLNVYGYSQGYGQADHKTTCDILRPYFPDYTIAWSNEGY